MQIIRSKSMQKTAFLTNFRQIARILKTRRILVYMKTGFFCVFYSFELIFTAKWLKEDIN